MIFAEKYNQDLDVWLIAIEIPMGLVPNDKIAVIKSMVFGFEEQLKLVMNLQEAAEQLQ